MSKGMTLLQSIELLTPAQMLQADLSAAEFGVAGLTLMRAAGMATARAICQRFRPCRTLVLTGPGHNGGDGYVVARVLESRGWPVAVAALSLPREGSDAAVVAAEWRGPIVPLDPTEIARSGLIVDALFGAGLRGDLPPGLVELLRGVSVPVVAIDVPSGVDGESGVVRGYALQATLTVTFFRLKPGHLLLPGRDLCGELVLAPIGLPTSVLTGLDVQCFANKPPLWTLPARTSQSHKYSLGHVTIPAGKAMPGAATLAAGAARRAGAGLVTLAAPDNDTATIFRGGEPGLLVREDSLEQLLQDKRRNAWLLGPGLPPDQETLLMLRQIVQAGREAVVDGGALTAATGNPSALKGAAVLTPHAGEFARVFGAAGENRMAAARSAAADTGAVVILKGSDSIIAAPDGRGAINADAPPALATAGSGDVLAGLVAGLLAQSMPRFEAACAAVWLHAEAARLALSGTTLERPLIAEALLTEISAAFATAHSIRAWLQAR
ncbi:NAD(P)H-hydrate dehydratase [Pseudoroseomonas globiformis]|uniref:Bifunctional NAD(P)H-hydrate repair enzyme n=1 Tax=Teichococcus globiformis TaxID=2307229 RepID=A0ABV7G405_9PROT